MVAEAFHLADDARHVKAGKCAARMRFDILGDQRSRIVIDLSMMLSFRKMRDAISELPFQRPPEPMISCREVRVTFLLRVRFYQFRIDRFSFRQVDGEACDTFGEVAEAFQVCIDLVHGKYETQVDSHRCVQDNDILAITVDL